MSFKLSSKYVVGDNFSRKCHYVGMRAIYWSAHICNSSHTCYTSENNLGKILSLAICTSNQTKNLYWVIGWVIVGCQSYQTSWQLQSGHSDNQVLPNIRILFAVTSWSHRKHIFRSLCLFLSLSFLAVKGIWLEST